MVLKTLFEESLQELESTGYKLTELKETETQEFTNFKLSRIRLSIMNIPTQHCTR